MSLELRPSWCLDDEAITKVASMGDWMLAGGGSAFDLDGDKWSPGSAVRIERELVTELDPIDLRRRLGLQAGATVGVAARWTCRTTAAAGTHRGGPTPIPLDGEIVLELEIPETVAGSIEIETCLLVGWSDTVPEGACPDGALVWSDGWSRSVKERTIVLEGSETRIPVRTVEFEAHFGGRSSALWAIEVDPSLQLEDLIANAVTVLLNRSTVKRDFRDADGEADPSKLPPAAISGIQVDLIRMLTTTLLDDLEDLESWDEYAEGTVGSILPRWLTEAFGSVASARADFTDDPASFSRVLWDRFAPETWRTG